MRRKLLAVLLMSPLVASIVTIVFYLGKAVIKVTDREMILSMLMMFLGLFKVLGICFLILIIVYCFVVGIKMFKGSQNPLWPWL
jgi:hypothetical protein